MDVLLLLQGPLIFLLLVNQKHVRELLRVKLRLAKPSQQLKDDSQTDIRSFNHDTKQLSEDSHRKDGDLLETNDALDLNNRPSNV